MYKASRDYVIIPLGDIPEKEAFRLRDIVMKSPGIAHAVVVENGFETWIIADIWKLEEHKLDLAGMNEALNRK